MTTKKQPTVGDRLVEEAKAAIEAKHCAMYAAYTMTPEDTLTEEQKQIALEAFMLFANLGWSVFHRDGEASKRFRQQARKPTAKRQQKGSAK